MKLIKLGAIDSTNEFLKGLSNTAVGKFYWLLLILKQRKRANGRGLVL
jgi:hypothetical protein